MSTVPFSATFVVGVVGATLLIRTCPDDEAILRWMSSNVDNLTDRPAISIVASAMYIDSAAIVGWALALAVVLACLERRHGTLLALVAFGSGHIVATVLTEAVVAVSIAAGALPHVDASLIDVGVSYGFASSLAFTLLLLPLRWSMPAVVGATGALTLLLADNPGLTSAGHAIAFGTGVGCAVALRRQQARGMARGGSTHTCHTRGRLT